MIYYKIGGRMNDKARIIDDALKETINRYYMKIRSNKKLCNLYIQLLCNIIDGNYKCITVLGKARHNLESLGRTVILMELVKNIVKVNSFYKSEKDYVPVKTNKNLDSDDLTVEEVELLIYREVLKDNEELVIDKLNENPRLLLGAVISFVDSRYDEKTKIPGLDVVHDYNDLMLLSQINRIQDQLIA